MVALLLGLQSSTFSSLLSILIQSRVQRLTHRTRQTFPATSPSVVIVIRWIDRGPVRQRPVFFTDPAKWHHILSFLMLKRLIGFLKHFPVITRVLWDVSLVIFWCPGFSKKIGKLILISSYEMTISSFFPFRNQVGLRKSNEVNFRKSFA